MKTSEILKDAFKYPISNVKRLVGLGLIILVYTLLTLFGRWAAKYSPLYLTLMMMIGLVVLVFCVGYYLRATRVSIMGENELPELNNWKSMFKDGIRVLLAGLIYYLIPVILIFAIAVSVAIKAIYKQNPFSLLTVMLIVVVAIIYLILTFLFVMAQANMAYKGKLEDAFSLGEIINIIKEIGALRYIFLAIIVMLVVGIIVIATFLVNKIPIVGIIISAIFISSYSQMFRARAYALIYREALYKRSQNTEISEGDE
ncbi:MAG: DUF4013 domain-containing protein, partial [Methanobacterium paludis]|nr:DUF4013 domain-containing protein [Methanobacterium paludis]